jgi:hypothetical protein
MVLITRDAEVKHVPSVLRLLEKHPESFLHSIVQWFRLKGLVVRAECPAKEKKSREYIFSRIPTPTHGKVLTIS